MNILVFGKDGQLGKAFNGLLTNLAESLKTPPAIQFIGREQCDLTDVVALNALLVKSNANLIINAAAYTAVDKAEGESDLAFAINARAPELIAQYAASKGACFLHYSTDYVFDGQKYGFYLEDDLRNPLGVYGKSKAAGEEAIAKAFASSGGFGHYAIFRTSWVYGDGGNFIRTILRLAKEREALQIIDDQYGVPTSADWLARVSLDFVCNPNLELHPFPSGIYHAVPMGETTWYGLACLAMQSALDAGVQLRVAPGNIRPIMATEYPLPVPRPMNSRMSTDKLRLSLGERQDMSKLEQFTRPWEEGVKAYVTRLANNGLI